MSAIFSIKAFSLRWTLKTSNFSCHSILAAFNFSKTKNIAVSVDNLVLHSLEVFVHKLLSLQKSADLCKKHKAIGLDYF